jgi:hypothetical protein
MYANGNHLLKNYAKYVVFMLKDEYNYKYKLSAVGFKSKNEILDYYGKAYVTMKSFPPELARNTLDRLAKRLTNLTKGSADPEIRDLGEKYSKMCRREVLGVNSRLRKAQKQLGQFVRNRKSEVKMITISALMKLGSIGKFGRAQKYIGRIIDLVENKSYLTFQKITKSAKVQILRLKNALFWKFQAQGLGLTFAQDPPAINSFGGSILLQKMILPYRKYLSLAKRSIALIQANVTQGTPGEPMAKTMIALIQKALLGKHQSHSLKKKEKSFLEKKSAKRMLTLTGLQSQAQKMISASTDKKKLQREMDFHREKIARVCTKFSITSDLFNQTCAYVKETIDSDIWWKFLDTEKLADGKKVLQEIRQGAMHVLKHLNAKLGKAVISRVQGWINQAGRIPVAFKLKADNLVLDLEKRLGKVSRRQSKEKRHKSMKANYRTVRDLWRSSAETI